MRAASHVSIHKFTTRHSNSHSRSGAATYPATSPRFNPRSSNRSAAIRLRCVTDRAPASAFPNDAFFQTIRTRARRDGSTTARRRCACGTSFAVDHLARMTEKQTPAGGCWPTGVRRMDGMRGLGGSRCSRQGPAGTIEAREFGFGKLKL
jgi:hypothetical protein